MPDGTRLQTGARGETTATAFLKRLGYRIAARNYTCPVGEIDIVAVDCDTVVFVEVRSRTADDDACPEQSVGYHKQRRVTRAAKHYVARKSLHDRPCRFDIVAVVFPEVGSPEVEHFIDAFGPVPR